MAYADSALRRAASVRSPTSLERYVDVFGDIDTRSMLMAGAGWAETEALLGSALERGSPLTDAEMDALCPRPRETYAPDELD